MRNPFERIALVISGPYPESDLRSGGDGLYFTKWMEAYVVPIQGAKTVAEELIREFISRFGDP